jgi:hypothetical protein
MLAWLDHTRNKTGWAGIPTEHAILAIEAEAGAVPDGLRDSAPAETVRRQFRAYLGDRFQGVRDRDHRSFRRAAAEIGVPFNTLARFARGRPVRSDTLDRIAAALAAAPAEGER